MMKKFLVIIFIAALAVLVLLRQPESCNLNVKENSFNLFLRNNSLYYVNGMVIKKILDEKIIDFKVYDIDNDENDELLVLTKSHNSKAFGKDLIIFKTVAIKEKLDVLEIYREDFSKIKPWKVDACNLDNDGQAEIFIGVYKDTIFYKDYRKRPFFYSWDGENLNKKWLGSFFSQWELVDITFGDFFNLGYDVVAILEKNEIKQYRVAMYNFIGFGFECMKITGNYKNIKTIETVKQDNNEFIILNSKNRYKLNFY